MRRRMLAWNFLAGSPVLSTSVSMVIPIEYAGTRFHALDKTVPLLIPTLVGNAYTWTELNHVYIGLLLTKIGITWCYWLSCHVAFWWNTGTMGRSPRTWPLRTTSLLRFYLDKWIGQFCFINVRGNWERAWIGAGNLSISRSGAIGGTRWGLASEVDDLLADKVRSLVVLAVDTTTTAAFKITSITTFTVPKLLWKITFAAVSILLTTGPGAGHIYDGQTYREAQTCKNVSGATRSA